MSKYVLVGIILWLQPCIAWSRPNVPLPVKARIETEKSPMTQVKEETDPAFAQLDFFIGWWHCHGHWSGSRQEKLQYWLLHAEKTKLVGWLQLTTFGPSDVSLESKKQLPQIPVARIDFWSYQSQSAKFLANWFENYGFHGTLTSLGWNGDRLDWEGEYSDALGTRLFQRWEIQKMGFKLLRDKRKVLHEDNWLTIHESLECKKLN